MDLKQKSTEEKNNRPVLLSFAASAQVTQLPQGVEEAIYDVASILESPKEYEIFKHALNVDNEHFIELELKYDGEVMMIIYAEPIYDADVYLDHILDGTYTVHNS